jgi:hypothetical protein
MQGSGMFGNFSKFGSVRELRASKKHCERCNLLTPKDNEACIHCAHISDENFNHAHQQLQNTYGSLARSIFVGLVGSIVILILLLSLIG